MNPPDDQRRALEIERNTRIEAAGIRAMLCASRGLQPSSCCMVGYRVSDIPDLPLQVIECDSEGGEAD